jgi:HK97 family phage major capsid protein
MKMDEIKQLIEQQGRAFEEFKKANDARLAAIEATGHAPADMEAKVDAINAEISRLSKDIAAAQRPAAGATDTSAEQTEIRNAFFGRGGFLRSGDDAELKRIQDTMRSSSDPDGGYLLPDATVGAIERVALNNNAMRQLATVTPIGGGGWREPVVTSGASSGFTGETGSRSASTTPTISEVKIEDGECYTLLPAYTRMLEDSSIDLESWLVEEAGYSFADTEGAAFVTGTGVNGPRGIAGYSFVANASYAWGKVGYTASGKAGALADTNPADYLIDMQHTLKAKYRQNGTWLMADATLAAIRKIQDGMGQYLWQPGLQLGAPDMLLGKPVLTDDNVAALASDSYSIFFADFKRAYRIVDRRGITILRDPYTTKGLVNFYLTRRVGGAIKNFEAIKAMKFSA